jgi:uncharacterized membrane protein YkoI
MKFVRLMVVGGLALGFSLSAGCAHKSKSGESKEENEVKMRPQDVPQAARAALEREAGGTAITTVDNEMSRGMAVYEADVMINGKNWEIKVDENGALLSKKLDEEEKEAHH